MTGTVVAGAPSSFVQLYVRDLATGTCTVASASADGTMGNGSTGAVDFAAGSDLVAFSSWASNLVGGDTADTLDVFVKNLTTGAVTLVDATPDGTRANANADLGGVSADGTKVAFTSAATNLDATDANGVADLFIKDLSTGALTRVATTTSGDLTGGVTALGLTSAGDKVLYLTSTQATADDHDAAVDAFVKDLGTGAITRVSASQDGSANTTDVSHAVISADGKKVLFTSFDALLPSAGSGMHAYVRDLTNGVLTLVSTDADGAPAVAAERALALSADGRLAAFAMYAVGDQPAGLYVKDLATGALTLVTNQYGEGFGVSPDRIDFSADSRELMVWGSTDSNFSDGAVSSGVFVFDLHPAGDDSLYGGDGADTLDGGPGDDILDGGADNDTVTYAQAVAGVHVNLTAAHAQNTGGAGRDTLTGVENLVGSSFDDVLGGSGGSNRLSGGDGNDTLIAGAGKDVLAGGAGNDVLDGGTGKNLVTYADATAGVTVDLSLTSAQDTGGAGIDTLTHFSGLSGSAFNDHLTGDDGRNHIGGGEGRDVLHGGGGADNLQGGAGNDTLEGGLGRDILNGAIGADTFLFDHTEAVSDTIRNLTSVDVIDLHLLDANANLAGDQAFTVVDHFHNHAGEARLNYQSGQNVTLLQLDTDGDGKANMTITLEGQHTDFTGFLL